MANAALWPFGACSRHSLVITRARARKSSSSSIGSHHRSAKAAAARGQGRRAAASVAVGTCLKHKRVLPAGQECGRAGSGGQSFRSSGHRRGTAVSAPRPALNPPDFLTPSTDIAIFKTRFNFISGEWVKSRQPALVWQHATGAERVSPGAPAPGRGRNESSYSR